MAITKDMIIDKRFFENPLDPEAEVITLPREYKDAYIRIESLKGTKNGIEIYVEYLYGETKKRFLSKYFTFKPDLESKDNFISQGYKYLKSQPEFNGAKDC